MWVLHTPATKRPKTNARAEFPSINHQLHRLSRLLSRKLGIMAGLESIALAVAHLERIQRGDEQPWSIVSDEAAFPSSNNEAHLPVPGSQSRMVSDGTYRSAAASVCAIKEGNDIVPSMSPTVSSSAPPQEYPSTTTSHHLPTIHEHGHPWGMMTANNNPNQAPPLSAHHQQEAFLHVPVAGPVATLLHGISCVSDNLDKFFALMEQLEKQALPDGARPADVPKPDETIVHVQRNDVLLGRGGETNHHIGNIQYRQLVKACQPAYLAAKRRDKPRIAAAIVGVVRARSGRFLKKHSVDNSWKDVGNTRAREKTSQALREGAPELRGTVEVSRTQLLTEAVAASRASDQGDEQQPSQRRATKGPANKQQRNTLKSPQRQPSPQVGRATLVSAPSGTVHPHHRHHGALPLVNGQIFYHPHPHRAVVPPMGIYHHLPLPPMDSHYHSHAFTEKRPMSMPSASEPPRKRLVVVARSPQAVPDGAVASSAREAHNLLPAAPTHDAEMGGKAIVSATVSAENSEEEPAPVRTASPASSTSSSKISASGRGPRVKLLKKRLDDDNNISTA